MDSPNVWYFSKQLSIALYRNHVVPVRQGSAAHEIQKIIKSPLPNWMVSWKWWSKNYFKLHSLIVHFNKSSQKYIVGVHMPTGSLDLIADFMFYSVIFRLKNVHLFYDHWSIRVPDGYNDVGDVRWRWNMLVRTWKCLCAMHNVRQYIC